MAPRLMELISARLERLDEDELHVLELLAYGDPLGLELLAGLAPRRQPPQTVPPLRRPEVLARLKAGAAKPGISSTV